MAEAGDAARSTIDCVRERTGVAARLMTKDGEPLLWMEVYEGIEDRDAFLEQLRQCVEASGLGRWLGGDRQRHTEIFRCA